MDKFIEVIDKITGNLVLINTNFITTIYRNVDNCAIGFQHRAPVVSSTPWVNILEQIYGDKVDV